MIRFIILFISIAFLFNFTEAVQPTSNANLNVPGLQDTVPFRVDEALIRELTQMPNAKTWRDSGYYFQFESIRWYAVRLGTTASGQVVMLASFTSADPASLHFQGRAIFRFDPQDIPADVSPSRGMTGTAVVAFPQDVLLCPSPSQEVGLGQNDLYFPLYLTGELSGVNVAGGGFLAFNTLMSVQLQDLEIIM